MTDRNDRSTERRPAEGVRIIGAEEAQAALEAGQAAGRLTEDELRFGDVPPTPSGPRPAHRFPLPDSVDPAEAVPRPPVAPLPRSAPTIRAQRASEATARRAEPAPGEGGGDREERVTVYRPGAHAPAGEPTDAAGAPAGEDTGERAAAAGPTPLAARPGRRHRVVPPPPPPEDEFDDYARLDGDDGDDTPEGDAQATLFTEADPTGRVPVFDPHALPDTAGAPPAEDRAGAPPAEDAEPIAAPLVEPPPPMATLGSGLRWATLTDDDPEESLELDQDTAWARPAGAGEVAGAGPDTDWDPVEDDGEARPAERPGRAGAPGEDPWAGVPGPDDPTDIHQAIDPDAGIEDYLDLDAEDRAGAPEPGGAAAGPRPTEEHPIESRPPEQRPDGGITVSGGPELPHWTDPPTGEVPISLAGLGGDDAVDPTGGVRWRSEHDDWADGPDMGDLAGDDLPLGALDQDRSEESDLYSFDEAFDRLEEERTGTHAALPFDDLPDELPDDEEQEGLIRVGGRGATRPARPERGERPTARPDRPAPRPEREVRPDLGSRLSVGIGLGVVLIVAYFVGAAALLALTTVAVLGAAGEAYTMLRRSSGFRPATLIGLLATVGLSLGAWWKGDAALGLVLAMATVATMLWYLLGVSDARPLANVMATLTVVAWVGLLGAYGAMLLRVPHGRGLFFGAVATAVLADVLAYFGGRSFGRRPLAPHISPGKTVEGLVAGGLGAVLVGVLVGHFVPGWGGVGDGVALGVVVAVFAPVGDLFESLIKRDLDVKDSGRTLAGHGGLLDRFDSILLVLPATYYLAVALHLA